MSGFVWVIRFLVSAFIVQGAWIVFHEYVVGQNELVDMYLQTYPWAGPAACAVLALLGLPLLYYPITRRGPKSLVGLYWLFRFSMCGVAAFSICYVAVSFLNPYGILSENPYSPPRIIYFVGSVASLTVLLLFTFIPITGKKVLNKPADAPPAPIPMEPIPPTLPPDNSAVLEVNDAKAPAA